MSTVRELLKIPGIDINAADKNGDTPLHVAAERGIILSTTGICLHLSTFSKGNFDVMAALTAVPNLATKNRAGNTPIHCAAGKGII